LTSPEVAFPEVKDVWKLASDPNVLRVWFQAIDRKAKRDIPSKLTTICVLISAHTRPLEPLNEFQKGESGSGKTLTTLVILKYFPEDCREEINYASKTSFIHQRSTLTDKNGKPMLDADEPKEPKRKFFVKGSDGDSQYQTAMAIYETSRNAWKERLDGSYYLVELLAWKTTDALLVSHDYEGKKSDPEWGLNISNKNMPLLERFTFHETVKNL
jgi:hypothetical protein